jgi:enterochelin esterase-like enzyme
LRALLLGAALASCAGDAFPKRLTYTELTSPAMQARMTYAVWAPADWTPEEQLPLVVFLHGASDTPDCLDRYGVAEALDRALAEKKLPRAVVVVPQGDLGFWVNWRDGSARYEDWVLDDVMTDVARHWRTQPCPTGCHLLGISMGGYGGQRLAMHRPERFASIASVSGPVIDVPAMIAFRTSWTMRTFLGAERAFGPADDPALLAKDDPFQVWRSPADVRTRLLFAWGTEDSEDIRVSNERLAAHFAASGIVVDQVVFEGGHDWPYWTPVIIDFLGRQLGAR